MTQAERQVQPSRQQSPRKRWLSLLKICLAVAILIVILANVKVNDHLDIPQDSPCAGLHVGRIMEQESMPVILDEIMELVLLETRARL